MPLKSKICWGFFRFLCCIAAFGLGHLTNDLDIQRWHKVSKHFLHGSNISPYITDFNIRHIIFFQNPYANSNLSISLMDRNDLNQTLNVSDAILFMLVLPAVPLNIFMNLLLEIFTHFNFVFLIFGNIIHILIALGASRAD